MGFDDVVLHRGRIIPSANDMNQVRKETIDKEDALWIKTWKEQGAEGLSQARPMPKIPPSREELLKFARPVRLGHRRGEAQPRRVPAEQGPH